MKTPINRVMESSDPQSMPWSGIEKEQDGSFAWQIVYYNNNDNMAPEEFPWIERRLNGTRGQAVLTLMYLCVLGLCFMTAVVYFCRMQWEERYLRRLREHELGQIRNALTQSEATQREESRAVQRKYIEERRARILQLFAPVRMTLAPENFCEEEKETTGAGKELASPDKGYTEGTLEKGNGNAEQPTENKDILMPGENVYGEEDSMMIEVPEPGLHLRLSASERPPTRLVSSMCTICLCTYEIGSDVVWSSNELCEHVFHEACIEKWLMKQREGPLCPCCRRDFIVDPYDMENQAAGLDQNDDEAISNRVQALYISPDE